MALEFALQNAIFQALNGVVSVPVYDDVASVNATGGSEGFPYITIGEDVLSEWGATDTDGAAGSITVHAWSRKRGRREVKVLQGEIYDQLHLAALTITGHSTVLIHWETSSSALDPDGITRHGVQTFRVIFHA